MPRGPKGEKRPADSVSAAVMIGRIATGEIPETAPPNVAKSKAGKIGGQRRAEKLSAQQRVEIAQKGGRSRKD